MGTGWVFTLRECPNPATYVARSETQAPYAAQATLALSVPASQARALMPPGVAEVTDISDGCRITTGGADVPGLAWHLLGIVARAQRLPGDVTVQLDAPPKVHTVMRELADVASGLAKDPAERSHS